MRKYVLIVSLLVAILAIALAVAVLSSDDASATTTWTLCDAVCHTTSARTDGVHVLAAHSSIVSNCANCHEATPSAVVTPSKCAVCHGSGDALAVSVASHGANCTGSTCHPISQVTTTTTPGGTTTTTQAGTTTTTQAGTTTTTTPGTTTTTTPGTTTTTTPTPPLTALFRDVPVTHPFFTYIQGLGMMGAVGGYNDGTFRPDALLMRDQAAKMLVIAFDFHDVAWTNWANPTFKDVPRPATQSESVRYPFDFVEEAFQNDVVLGYSDGTFRPYNNITRAQLALMIVRIGGDALKPATADDKAHFTDLAGVIPEAKAAIAVCFANGIISGKTATTFDPFGTATRAHAAKMIFNLTEIMGTGM